MKENKPKQIFAIGRLRQESQNSLNSVKKLIIWVSIWTWLLILYMATKWAQDEGWL